MKNWMKPGTVEERHTLALIEKKGLVPVSLNRMPIRCDFRLLRPEVQNLLAAVR
jgi:hypothetical protein